MKVTEEHRNGSNNNDTNQHQESDEEEEMEEENEEIEEEEEAALDFDNNEEEFDPALVEEANAIVEERRRNTRPIDVAELKLKDTAGGGMTSYSSDWRQSLKCYYVVKCLLRFCFSSYSRIGHLNFVGFERSIECGG